MADHATTAVLDTWVRRFATLVADNKDYLTELDAAIGDADHGSNLDRGMTAAVAALDELGPTSAGPLFSKVGMTLVSTVGGASGPLFGTLFLRMGTSLGDTDTVDAAQIAAALRAGLDGVEARGKAQPGDKTMYDALAPAVDALDKSVAEGADLADGLATPRPRVVTRPPRCSPARDAPATSVNAASATRTPAPPASRCCCRQPP